MKHYSICMNLITMSEYGVRCCVFLAVLTSGMHCIASPRLHGSCERVQRFNSPHTSLASVYAAFDDLPRRTDRQRVSSTPAEFAYAVL